MLENIQKYRQSGRKSFSGAVCTAIVCLLCLLSQDVAAKKNVRPMDLDCAVRTVAEKTGGRILSADVVETRKGNEFRIKVLTPRGHVRYVRIREDEKCEY